MDLMSHCWVMTPSAPFIIKMQLRDRSEDNRLEILYQIHTHSSSPGHIYWISYPTNDFIARVSNFNHTISSNNLDAIIWLNYHSMDLFCFFNIPPAPALSIGGKTESGMLRVRVIVDVVVSLANIFLPSLAILKCTHWITMTVVSSELHLAPIPTITTKFP